MPTIAETKPRRPTRRGDPRLARFLNPPTARERAALGDKPPAPTGRVWGYVRVSTVQQVSEGESLDVQQRTIAGYAQMHGFAIERVFVERGVLGPSRSASDRRGRHCLKW